MAQFPHNQLIKFVMVPPTTGGGPFGICRPKSSRAGLALGMLFEQLTAPVLQNPLKMDGWNLQSGPQKPVISKVK